MADNVKITGTVDHFRAEETPARNAQSDVALTVELPLRDLFAAFALSAVISLDLEDASHRTDAIYAYAAADAMLSHYRIGDWEAYLFFRKPDCPDSYVLKYEATAGDGFAEKIVLLHKGKEDNYVTPLHECRECGQECDCIADTCCHPDTAECGVSQNFEDQPQ
jgi:hypothetical protein